MRITLRLLTALICLVGLAISPTPARVALPPIHIVVGTAVDSNAAHHQACTEETDDDCSLGGAISLTNVNPARAYAIGLPAGAYALTLTGTRENANASGDLDVVSATPGLRGVGAVADTGNGTSAIVDMGAYEFTLQYVYLPMVARR